MTSNPILEELYAVREQLLARHGGNVAEFLQALRQRESETLRKQAAEGKQSPAPTVPTSANASATPMPTNLR